MKINSSPFAHNRSATSSIMKQVIIAMFPAYGAMVFAFGMGVVIQTLLGILWAWILEIIVAKLRGRPWLDYCQDYSGMVTAMILALSIPFYAPWWVVIIGVSVAILIAKHPYGGLGQNLFNPAMVGYAVLLTSFPAIMSSWAIPQTLIGHPIMFEEAWNIIWYGHGSEQIFHGTSNLDGLTQATPLDSWRTGLKKGLTNVHDLENSPLFKPIFPWGIYQPQGWTQVNLAFLIGGLYLLARKIISWQIPLAVLTSFGIASGISAFYSTSAPDVLWQFSSGAIMFGAFFIVTEPVTAPMTGKGQVIFGILVGLMIYLIRYYSAYHDGVAFAVLIGNMLVPLIDYFSRPRVFGR